MRRIFLIIFLLVSVISFGSFPDAYAEPGDNASDSEQLSTLSYELAYLLESSGQDLKAAEEYLHILANYPDSIPNFSKAFSRLRLLCAKYDANANRVTEDPMEAYEAKKEHERFYSTIQNVYGSYNTKGEYRKAIQLITYLLRIEEKTWYYIDRGNIYLYGLNDPTKALADFEKIMEMEPDHPTVYTDIGIANEYLGNYDKARIAYNKAAKISPQNNWVHYGLSRAKGIDLADESQIIKDWFFIGQFDSFSKLLPVEKQIIEELDIKKEYKLEDREKLFWFRPFKESDFGFVNLSNIFMKKDFVRAYALTWVYSPIRRRVLFRVGGDDGVSLWVNGNKLMDNLESQAARVDDDIVRGYLREGWNPILLKVTQLWGGWGFYFRITDLKGNTIDELVFDPKQDDERAKRLIKGVEKNRIYKMVRWGVFYSIILLIIIILSINILNTFKTKKVRENFVSSITHDLKIPLAAILAATEMLIDGNFKDDERRSRYYSIIEEEAKRLNVYVSRILEFSRNPKIKKRYLLEERNIVSTVEKAISIYKKEGLAHELDISLKKEGNIPLVALDEEAFVQVVVNLISNADKYSLKDKRIEITIGLVGDKVEVRVKDYGIGMRAEDVKSVFKPFFRSDNVKVLNISGAGLGLAFIKKIVELHKGKIAIESVLGEGSVFVVQLPVA